MQGLSWTEIIKRLRFSDNHSLSYLAYLRSVKVGAGGSNRQLVLRTEDDGINITTICTMSTRKIDDESHNLKSGAFNVRLSAPSIIHIDAYIVLCESSFQTLSSFLSANSTLQIIVEANFDERAAAKGHVEFAWHNAADNPALFLEDVTIAINMGVN